MVLHSTRKWLVALVQTKGSVLPMLGDLESTINLKNPKIQMDMADGSRKKNCPIVLYIRTCLMLLFVPITQ